MLIFYSLIRGIMTDMQPQNQESHVGLEQQPTQPQTSGERIPVLPSPESGIETGAERREQTADAQAAVANATAVSQPVAQISTDPIVTTQTTVTPPGPLVAADEDVIEKEWVDKAKQIITETRDDPYARTNRVNELQRDYLNKRYGKQRGNQAAS